MLDVEGIVRKHITTHSYHLSDECIKDIVTNLEVEIDIYCNDAYWDGYTNGLSA